MKRTADTAGVGSPFNEGFKGKRSRAGPFGVTTFPPSDSFAQMISAKHSGMDNPFEQTKVNLEINADEVDVPQFDKNGWKAMTKIMRPTIVDLGTKNQEMMLFITKKVSREPQLDWSRTTGYVRRNTMLNITTWNFIMASQQRIPESIEDCTDPIDILNDYYIEGVMMNQNVQEGKPSEQQTSYPTNMEQTASFIVQGGVDTKNIWGSHVQTGTKLFLILKKVQSNGIYILDAEGIHRQTLNVGNIGYANRDDLVTNRPFQLVPYAHPSYSYPPEDEICYEDEFGIMHRGIVITVGRVLHNGSPNYNSIDLKTCVWNYNAMVKASTIRVFVDPDF